MVTEERNNELRAMVDKVEAERMQWIGETVEGLVARGISRKRICVDMTDDKLCLAIGVDQKLVADCEIVIDGKGIRFVGRVHRRRGPQKRVLTPKVTA